MDIEIVQVERREMDIERCTVCNIILENVSIYIYMCVCVCVCVCVRACVSLSLHCRTNLAADHYI